MVLFSCTAPRKVAENPAAFVWEPMPLVTQTVLDRGYVGGEGGQVPKAIAIDPVDGHFLLYGTEVGGIARSTDGGQNREPANQGFSPLGNSGFAIDPNNINRVLAVGVNTINNPFNGIYLSVDQAKSWKQVLSVNFCGLNDVGEQIVFDKRSFDSQKVTIPERTGYVSKKTIAHGKRKALKEKTGYTGQKMMVRLDLCRRLGAPGFVKSDIKVKKYSGSIFGTG